MPDGVMLPWLTPGLVRPAIALSKVVFPLPEGPTSATISPGAHCNIARKLIGRFCVKASDRPDIVLMLLVGVELIDLRTRQRVR
jgi:hypothetical protein